MVADQPVRTLSAALPWSLLFQLVDQLLATSLFGDAAAALRERRSAALDEQCWSCAAQKRAESAIRANSAPARPRAESNTLGETLAATEPRLAAVGHPLTASCMHAASVLLTDLRRNAPGALARLRAYVPRHTATTDSSTAERGDARLIIAREFGFGTRRELVSFAEKSVRDLNERGRSGNACTRRPKPCWPATPAGWPS